MYNLSLYDHPGGDLKNCGSDITGDFYQAHETSMLKGTLEYAIGPYLDAGDGGGVGIVGSSGGSLAMAELSSHDSKGSCWTAYHGNV